MSNDPVAGATDDERREYLRQADEAVNNSDGKKLSVRTSSFRRIVNSWCGFAELFLTLLDHCENDEEASAELVRHFGDLSAQDRLILGLDQAVLAYTSGLCAVIDQARIIERKYLSDDHKEESSNRNEKIKQNHPYGIFFAKLRNHILHSLSAPWTFTAELDSGTGTVGLKTEPLLNNAKLDSSVKELLCESGDTIVISKYIRPHLEAMLHHCEWLARTAVNDQPEAIEEHDQLVERRNLILTAGAWGGRNMDARIAELERQLAERRGEENDG